MPYVQNFSVLQSVVDISSGAYNKSAFYSNGVYVRNNKGEKMMRFGESQKEKNSLCYFFSQQDGPTLRGYVESPPLVERILEYLDVYHGTYKTNCAAFAHFLITGVFVPCDGTNKNFIITGSMTTYWGQKIEIGDVVCLMYFHPLFHRRSPRNSSRAIYRAHKKDTHHGTSFFDIGKRETPFSFLKDEIKYLALEGLKQFHFLVCVGRMHGEPVFIQQLGLDIPGDDRYPAPIVFSLGGYDSYANAKYPLEIVLVRKGSKNKKLK